jgi:hypothetical protein
MDVRGISEAGKTDQDRLRALYETTPDTTEVMLHEDNYVVHVGLDTGVVVEKTDTGYRLVMREILPPGSKTGVLLRGMTRAMLFMTVRDTSSLHDCGIPDPPNK